jgi:hypothetical protein
MLIGGDKVSMRDFVFGKQVKFGRYASVSSQPPGAIVVMKALLSDEMATPPYKWRVPYVVVWGPPGAALRSLVCSPEEVLARGSTLRVNYLYYITKCINPSLDRLFSVCGVDITSWFKDMTRPQHRVRHVTYHDGGIASYYARDETGSSGIGGIGAADRAVFHGGHRSFAAANAGAGRTGGGLIHALPRRSKQTSMDQFTTQETCAVCGKDSLPRRSLCALCLADQNMQTSMVVLRGRLNYAVATEKAMEQACVNCARCHTQKGPLFVKHAMIGPDCCESLDCDVFFDRCRIITRIEDLTIAVHDIEDIP